MGSKIGISDRKYLFYSVNTLLRAGDYASPLFKRDRSKRLPKIIKYPHCSKSQALPEISTIERWTITG